MTIKDQYFISILTAKELASRDRRRNELISLGYTDIKCIDFLLQLSYNYTPLAFECFIAYFLQTHYQFKMTVQGGLYDQGVDIVGYAIGKDGVSYRAFVQCKRWNVNDIGLAQAAEFYGHVADICHKTPNTSLFYATTGFVTGMAREFFDKKNITYIDFDVLMETREYISLEGFHSFLNLHAQELVQSKKDKDQTQIFIETNRDAFELLRKIRSSLASEYRVPAYIIAKDQQLCEIIKHQPRSLGELMRVGGLSTQAVTKYGPEIIKALKTITSP